MENNLYWNYFIPCMSFIIRNEFSTMAMHDMNNYEYLVNVNIGRNIKYLSVKTNRIKFK